MMIIALGMIFVPSAQAEPDSSDSTIYPQETKQPAVFKGIRIYPNPVDRLLYINSPKENEEPFAEVVLYSKQGRKIKEIELTEELHKEDLNFLEPGFYYLTIRKNDHVCHRKILKR